VVRTVVWETMVAGDYGRSAKVRSVGGKGRGGRGTSRTEEERKAEEQTHER